MREIRIRRVRVPSPGSTLGCDFLSFSWKHSQEQVNFEFRLCKSHLQYLRQIKPISHEGGVPQVGEVTCVKLPHLTCKRDHIKMRDFLDRRVTSPTWGRPPPCNVSVKSKL